MALGRGLVEQDEALTLIDEASKAVCDALPAVLVAAHEHNRWLRLALRPDGRDIFVLTEVVDYIGLHLLKELLGENVLALVDNDCVGFHGTELVLTCLQRPQLAVDAMDMVFTTGFELVVGGTVHITFTGVISSASSVA